MYLNTSHVWIHTSQLKISMNLGNQLRKELNNVINVGSELPSDTPIREQPVKKKQDLETYMDVPLI